MNITYKKDDEPIGASVPLKYACVISKDTLPETTDPAFEFDYIDIGSVSLGSGIKHRERFRFENAPSRARKRVSDGDIILSMVRTYLKSLAMIDNINRECIVSTGFAVLKPKEGIDSGYLYYVCQSSDFLRQVQALSTGVSYPAITSAALGSIKIPLRSYDSQILTTRFICEKLERIDHLIIIKKRQVEVIREREEAAFHVSVAGKDRLGIKKHSGYDWMGEIPNHWKAPRLTHIAKLETGHTPSRKEDSYWIPEECLIPWFTLADVWQLRNGDAVYVQETAERISETGMANSSARLLPTDTVILSRTASVGFAGILSVPMATTQDFVGWICGPLVQPKFLYYVLRAMKPVFRSLMMGSTHQTIYMPDIRSFRLPLPPIKEQDEIVEKLDKTNNCLREASIKITESIKRLQEYRSAIISAAVADRVELGTETQEVAAMRLKESVND